MQQNPQQASIVSCHAYLELFHLKGVGKSVALPACKWEAEQLI